jgi:hypothetical protein
VFAIFAAPHNSEVVKKETCLEVLPKLAALGVVPELLGRPESEDGVWLNGIIQVIDPWMRKYIVVSKDCKVKTQQTINEKS